MGLNDAVQSLKKADILKEKVENCRDLLNDGDAWVWQQQLQRIYQQVLLQDLEYALDCKVEQELWNYGFKNYICILQTTVKDKKNPKRIESQAMLTWCLEAASGFYLTLLQEICTAFDLDLSFRRRDSVYGISDNFKVVSNRLIQPNTTSCSYICQHCLVHLGDIARYRNQSRQAESFYRHAVQLSPYSGQPYNQLALLDSSRGDRLGTVFHYVRSVAVKHPFPAAATNLKRMFGRFAEDQLNLDGRSKLTIQEYVALFLKFHGLLYLGGDLTKCSRTIRLLTDTLTAQVATESFTSRKLVQMLAVNLYALHNARGHIFPAENDKHIVKEEVSCARVLSDKMQAKSLVLDLMAGSLSALLLPVYTIRESEALLEYFALPAIKLTLDWIQLDPHVLNDQAFTSRLQIWPSLCKLLNGLQTLLSNTDQCNKLASIPLPEDRELHGFLPLSIAMRDLQFNCEDAKIDSPEINRLRATRLVKFGVWLSKQEDSAVVTAREVQSNHSGETKTNWAFEAIAAGQTPSSELIKELEQLSLGVSQSPQLPSPSPSDAGSWGGSSTSTPGGAISPTLLPPVFLEQVTHVPEKRTGILKPQGSLEKSREKEMLEAVEGGLVVGSGRKAGRQNIAMQTILRKGVTLAPETDVKQVSFKTPSPPPLDHSNGWGSKKSKPAQPQPINPQQSISSSQSQLSIPGIPKTDFSHPPPPLQQLQQQAQARVVHMPPQNMYPLPPMSIPPPCIQPNLLDLASHNFPLSENAAPMQSYGVWQEEPSRQTVMSDSSSRNTWWPVSSSQPTPEGSISRSQPQSLCGNVYNGMPSWGSAQQHAFQRLPSQLQIPSPLQHGNSKMKAQPFILPQQQMHANLPLATSQHRGQLYTQSGSISTQHEPQFSKSPFTSSLTCEQLQPQKSSSSEKRDGLYNNTQGFSPYSLFSTNNWLSPAISPGQGTVHCDLKRGPESVSDDVNHTTKGGAAIMGAQSLWSGPGPSPLERLLEQQKQLREGPSPKSGT